MVKTPHFHCRGHRLDPWSGTKILQARVAIKENKRKEKKRGNKNL